MRSKRVPPMRVLVARAQALALLYACWDIDLGTAVETLRLYAIESGLTARLGQEAVDRMIITPFAPYLEPAV